MELFEKVMQRLHQQQQRRLAGKAKVLMVGPALQAQQLELQVRMQPLSFIPAHTQPLRPLSPAVGTTGALSLHPRPCVLLAQEGITVGGAACKTGYDVHPLLLQAALVDAQRHCMGERVAGLQVLLVLLVWRRTQVCAEPLWVPSRLLAQAFAHRAAPAVYRGADAWCLCVPQPSMPLILLPQTFTNRPSAASKTVLAPEVVGMASERLRQCVL
mmetsp:Transcript_16230/g.44409  ORF Transcript_16230/g.44409 Transcript_16230/m.44409 type:complete len:214 (+) Transcript_16230:769-1410(+)